MGLLSAAVQCSELLQRISTAQAQPLFCLLREGGKPLPGARHHFRGSLAVPSPPSPEQQPAYGCWAAQKQLLGLGPAVLQELLSSALLSRWPHCPRDPSVHSLPAAGAQLCPCLCLSSSALPGLLQLLEAPVVWAVGAGSSAQGESRRADHLD